MNIFKLAGAAIVGAMVAGSPQPGQGGLAPVHAEQPQGLHHVGGDVHARRIQHLPETSPQGRCFLVGDALPGEFMHPCQQPHAQKGHHREQQARA